MVSINRIFMKKLNKIMYVKVFCRMRNSAFMENRLRNSSMPSQPWKNHWKYLIREDKMVI